MKSLSLRSPCSVVLTLVFSCAALAHSSPPELTPSGTGDDTARLQAALSKCAGQRSQCAVRLGSGTFYTDVLLVKGFSGSITGRGQGRTIIKPLAFRPLRSSPTPWVDEPTLAQPYPVLLHFANDSKVSISKLTIDVPADMRVMPYETPYPGSSGEVTTEALSTAILVDGVRNAELVMSHVTIIGVDNETFEGSNLSSAVRFEGQIRFQNGVDRTRKLQRGRIVALDNRIQRTGFGIQALDGDRVEGLFVRNRMDTRIYAISLFDLGASKLAVVGNTIDSELAPVFIGQTPELRPTAASDFLVAQNWLRVNATGKAEALDPEGGYGGVVVFDFGGYSDPIETEQFQSDVTIWANDIVIPETLVKRGLDISGDGSGDFRVIGNRIRGAPFESGIHVELSRGTYIAGNDLRGVAPPDNDIFLTDTTRNVRVIEPGDTVTDDGTDNLVTN
jgi:hypothetical protein